MLAALIGLLGDFDRAEEAMQEAFAIAAHRWAAGIPFRVPAEHLLAERLAPVLAVVYLR